MPSVLQSWVSDLPFMQQTTLLTAIRGPDGRAKYDPPKMLLRWYRRCVLISALDGVELEDPYDVRGGSFTGPSLAPYISATPGQGRKKWHDEMKPHVDEYLKNMDALPSHFQRHFMHAVQILGYKHPVSYTRDFWFLVYHAIVREMHLTAESVEDMDKRLSDNRDAWLARTNTSTQT